MQILRRAARPSDTAFARSVHHRAYRGVVERQFGPWDEEAQDRFFATGWASAPHEIILCDEVACGYVSVEDRPDEVHVRELVLLPEYQGRGIGSAVLGQIMEQARARGVPIHLQTFILNRAAGLYRRLGFHEIGRTHTHILLEWRE